MNQTSAPAGNNHGYHNGTRHNNSEQTMSFQQTENIYSRIGGGVNRSVSLDRDGGGERVIPVHIERESRYNMSLNDVSYMFYHYFLALSEALC